MSLMPKRLVLVRHGQSEGNLAVEMLKRGEQVPRAFYDRHTSEFRLTDRGISQAKVTGKWIRDNLPPFDIYMVSEYVRALETAAHLNLPGARWIPDLDLRERDHGFDDLLTPGERMERYARELELYKKNPLLFPTPGGGESVAMVRNRCARIYNRLRRPDVPYDSVILCCHGIFMWAWRLDNEHMRMKKYLELDSSIDPYDRIHNCQVFEYSRENPFVPGDVKSYYGWVRSLCPSNMTLSRNEWTVIEERQKRSNEELLREVECYRRVLG